MNRLSTGEQRHLIERFRRILDGRVLEFETIDEDPRAFKQPLRSISYFIKDDRLASSITLTKGNTYYIPHGPKKN